MTVDARSPVYRRQLPRFEDCFGASPATVLRSMDAACDDVVEREPSHPIPIAAGCIRNDVLVNVMDPFGSARVVPAIASVRIESTVAATRRGLHMSRIGDVLAASSLESHADLGAFARALADAVRDSQHSGGACVAVEARIPYVEEVPYETGCRAKLSLEHLDLHASATTGPQPDVEQGIRVTHLVACPCVQQTYRHARAARSVTAEIQDQPGFTHVQRCRTSLTARGVARPFVVPRVLAALDTVLCRTLNTLPRASELLLVFRAHRRPQFVEDAVRDAAAAFCRGLDPDYRFTTLDVSASSLESIHDYDLSAALRLGEEECRRLVAGREPFVPHVPGAAP